MKSEKFFEAFTELDDDLIENALHNAQNLEIVRPAERVFSWRPVAAAAALVVFTGGMTLMGMKLYNSNKHSVVPTPNVTSDNEAPQESSISSKVTDSIPEETSDRTSVNYSYINVDYLVYNSVSELADAGDYIVAGKVTNISFELHYPTGELLKEYTKERTEDAQLCTIYDVNISTSYKGSEDENVRIIMYNGLEDYEVDKQLEVLGGDTGHSIPVLENPVDINIGEEYLFVLSQSISQSSTGDTMTCLVNPSQGAFRADRPTVKEKFSQASLNDIVDYLTNNDDKSDVLSVIHNDQSMALSEQENAALTQAIMDALANDCLPELTLNTMLTEQDVQDYGKNGYVIKLQYSDISDPVHGEGSDKKAQVIWNATVLIGGESEPSCITYSYDVYSLNGASEHHYGGTYLLKVSTSDKILQILNSQDVASDKISVIHNDQSVALSEQSSAALTNMVKQLLTTDDLSELQTTITEQDIKEYSKNGYVVTIKYNYETEINNVAVFIGEEGQTSYIFSSWTVSYSAPPPPESHTFLLDSSSRDSILQILNPIN